MKQFTVVFPVARIQGIDFILLGKQRTGKPLAGYLNGYGGKVEDSDGSVLAAANRELQEELGVALSRPKYIGSLVHQTKEVFFFLSTAEYTSYADTGEMIENTWFRLSDKSFEDEMLPGDNEIIQAIRANIDNYFENNEIREFRILKEGLEIDRAVQELNKSLGLK